MPTDYFYRGYRVENGKFIAKIDTFYEGASWSDWQKPGRWGEFEKEFLTEEEMLRYIKENCE